MENHLTVHQPCFDRRPGSGFNGLLKGENFALAARGAVGLELSPVRNVGRDGVADMEVCGMAEARLWSVYLRLGHGEARVLHDAALQQEASHALVAAGRKTDCPAAVLAWDFTCHADSVRALPEALRRGLWRRVSGWKREAHAGFALAARIDLALHDRALRLPGG